MTRGAMDEDHEVAEIADRLTARFPDLPKEKVSAAVDDARHRFDDARVRDFVPVLIEREARARLEQPR